MKRPFTIYLIVAIIGAFSVPLFLFLVTSQFGLYLFPFQKEIWLYRIPGGGFKIFLWFFDLVLLPAIYGLYRGRAWARNLIFFLLLILGLNAIGALLRIFAITAPNEFSGLARFLAALNLLMLAFAFLLFYLMLRPEVGKFCGAYPLTKFNSKQNSSPS